MIHICKFCKKDFQAPPSDKAIYCSRNCKTSNGRKNNLCFHCGKQFTSKKHQLGKYCSQKCANARGPASKGGKTFSQGYVYILQPHHPFSDGKGYVAEHRLVTEKEIGRFLTEKEVIHHKNRNRADNRIENLQLFSNHSEHLKEHAFNKRVKYWGANDHLK